MKWEDLTSPEFGNIDRRLPVILNVAAIEQHGVHLPVKTDAAIGSFLTDLLDQASPETQLILPQVKVGCSSHHLDFDGTLSVPHSAFQAYVTGILESVVNSGFRNLLLLNSHGGNIGIGQVTLETFGFDHPECKIAIASWWNIAAEELKNISETGKYGSGHACEIETSVMMASNQVGADAQIPEGLIATKSFDWTNGSMLYGSQAVLYRTMAQLTNGTGIQGQPDAASKEKGQRIADVTVAGLLQIVKDMHGLAQSNQTQ